MCVFFVRIEPPVYNENDVWFFLHYVLYYTVITSELIFIQTVQVILYNFIIMKFATQFQLYRNVVQCTLEHEIMNFQFVQ